MFELELHSLPELEVECAQRLIQQQHSRPVDQRPGQRHPLLLAAAQLSWGACAELRELHHLERLIDPGGALFLRHALHPQAILDVLAHTHVGKQRVLLKNGVDVALEGGKGRNVRPIHQDLAVGGWLEARDHPERRRFARSGGTEESEKFPGGDGEREVVYRRKGAEALGEVPELQQGRHRGR